MDLLTLLLLAAGLAMDAFAVSVACGLAFERREHGRAITIAFSFGLFQALMPVVGWLAGLSVRPLIESVDHWVVFVLLAVLGGRMILEAIRSHRRREAFPPPGNLQLLGLSIATSIDALAVGLALSLLNVSILAPALVIGAVTFAISFSGIVLGHELERWLPARVKRDVHIAGGVVLIGIGVRILAQHLAP